MFLVLGCSLKDLKRGVFSVTSCGFHSSLGCAGQAISACHPDYGEEDPRGYASCITEKSQGCMVKSLSRCALSGAVRAVGSLVAGGGAGCGTEAHRDQALQCVAEADPHTESDAVEASAGCWMKVCGF